MGTGQRFRRHVPPLLFLRRADADDRRRSRGRQAVVTLPSQHETIILAMDVSGSMRADRRRAQSPGARRRRRRARSSPTSRQTRAHRRGVVRAATASVVQPPTRNARGHHRGDRPLPVAARHRGRQRHPRVAEDDLPRRRVRPAVVEPARATARKSPPLDEAPRDPDKDQRSSRCRRARTRRPRSSCSPTARRRPGPTRSRRRAWPADRGVRVYTVGIGTDGGRDHRRRRLVDARAPRRGVAEDDRQRHARRIFLRRQTRERPEEGLQNRSTRKLVFEQKQTEITALFVAAAALFALLAGLLSVLVVQPHSLGSGMQISGSVFSDYRRCVGPGAAQRRG